MQRHFLKNLSDITLPLEQYHERQEFMLHTMALAQQQCGVKLLDPVPYLCSDGKVCMGSKNGTPLYVDDNHLSYEGSKLLAPLFEPIYTSP